MSTIKREMAMDYEAGAGAGVDAQNTITDVRVNLTPKSLATAFGLTVALLILAHTFVQTCRFALGAERFYGLVFMFSLGADGNVPTY